jgi:hypothetical protein
MRRTEHHAMTLRPDTSRALSTLIVALLVIAAGACGGDDDGTSDSTRPASPSTPTTSGPVSTEGGAIPEAALSVRYEHADAGVEFEYAIACADASAVTGEVERAEIDADAACAALAEPAVVDRLVSGPAADQVCTMIYGGPDVAHIEGAIAGTHVDTRVDRANGCGISDWDDLLDPLLPPAIGATAPS